MHPRYLHLGIHQNLSQLLVRDVHEFAPTQPQIPQSHMDMPHFLIRHFWCQPHNQVEVFQILKRSKVSLVSTHTCTTTTNETMPRNNTKFSICVLLFFDQLNHPFLLLSPGTQVHKDQWMHDMVLAHGMGSISCTSHMPVEFGAIMSTHPMSFPRRISILSSSRFGGDGASMARFHVAWLNPKNK